MVDQETLAAYNQAASRYADLTDSENLSAALTRFVDSVANGGRVLDFGCGPGKIAAKLQDAGLVVEAWDASAEMVTIARDTYKIEAKQAQFSDLSTVGIYDGICASFSLLHASKAEFPKLIAACHRALKTNGVLHLSMKIGEGEQRDRLGRFYSYYTRVELDDILTGAGFRPFHHFEGESVGLAGSCDPFIEVLSYA